MCCAAQRREGPEGGLGCTVKNSRNLNITGQKLNLYINEKVKKKVVEAKT